MPQQKFFVFLSSFVVDFALLLAFVKGRRFHSEVKPRPLPEALHIDESNEEEKARKSSSSLSGDKRKRNPVDASFSTEMNSNPIRQSVEPSSAIQLDQPNPPKEIFTLKEIFIKRRKAEGEESCSGCAWWGDKILKTFRGKFFLRKKVFHLIAPPLLESRCVKRMLADKILMKQRHTKSRPKKVQSRKVCAKEGGRKRFMCFMYFNFPSDSL